MGDILELAMLICFSASWPVLIYNSYKSRTTQGKSLVFVLLIFSGYVFGAIAKLARGEINYLIWVYIATLILISIDICLYFRNKKLDNLKKNNNE